MSVPGLSIGYSRTVLVRLHLSKSAAVRALRATLAGLTLMTGLSACAPDALGPAKFDNYLNRLSRALDTEVPEPPLIVPPRIADAHLQRVAIEESKIGVLDFLSLSGCELQVNLGRRNSSLGRNASPSQRLLLDLEFIDLAPACAELLRSKGEPNLAEDILAIAHNRQRELPGRIYNALLAGTEFQSFWHLPPSLDDYPSAVGGDVADSLHWFAEQIERWLAGNTTADNREVEWQLSQLRSGDGGALMLASAITARALTQGSEMLATRASRGSLCPASSATETSKVLETVTAKFFVGDVQPWLAQVNQRHHHLLTPIRRIENLLEGILPPDYRRWQDERDQLLMRLQAAPREHVNALKAAMADCPGLVWRSAEQP